MSNCEFSVGILRRKHDLGAKHINPFVSCKFKLELIVSFDKDTEERTRFVSKKYQAIYPLSNQIKFGLIVIFR